MIHKGFFFIFKEVTVKYKELHSAKPPLISQRQAEQTILCSSKRKNPTRKKKKRVRSLALKKSHNTSTKFHYREVTITSKDYKIFLCILKITVSQTILYISQGKNHKKGKEKEKERGREKEKEKEKEKKNGESGT